MNEAIDDARKALALGSERASHLLSDLQHQSSSAYPQSQPRSMSRHVADAHAKPPKFKPCARFDNRALSRVSDDDDLLPSGYRRSDYYDYGATDDIIEYWGLDQPGAPAPQDAGIAVWDVLDPDYDGDFDEPWG